MMPFLEASLIRPLGLVVAAWLVLRVFRVQHPASRHAVWTAVLAGMLLLPIVSVVAPRWTLRVLPSEPAVESRTVPELPAVSPLVEAQPATATTTDALPVETGTASFVWPSSEQLILGLYLVGVVALAMYRLMGWLLLRRVLARSTSLRPACLRESADVVTPVAVGVLRPSVILPANWRTWPVRTRRAVLAHEFAHLRRRDTLVAALARLVTSVLWFHPAAWWVSRQISSLAELACDAVALERVGDPGGYSRVLVEFASAVHRSGRRVALPGLAIASGSQMNDRVDQVFEMSTGTMRKLARPRVWLAFGIVVTCLVATGMLGARSLQQSIGPKFDVISIKPCGEETPAPAGARNISPFSVKLSPGYAYWDCVTVSTLILQAYTGNEHALLNNVTFGRGERDHDVVKGAPNWTRSEKFTIEARGAVVPKYPNGYQGDLPSELRLMIRAMLEDRFALKMRHVTEERPLYALSVAAGGIKIGPPAPTKCWKWSKTQTTPPPGYEGLRACGYSTNVEWSGGDKVFQYSGVSFDNVAVHLTSLMDRNVVNKTGLEGRFDFSIKLAADENTPGVLEADAKEAERWKNMRSVGGFAEQLRAQGIDPNAPPKPRPASTAPNIFKAFELVGLKLEAAKGPQEFLVVDSVARPKPNSPAFAEASASAKASGFVKATADKTAGKPDVAPAPASRAREMPDSGPSAPVSQQTGTSSGPIGRGAVQDAVAANADKVKFDVVSIKPCANENPDVRQGGRGAGAAGGPPRFSPGHAYWSCVTLSSLIDEAWGGGSRGPLDSGLLNTLNRAREDSPKRVRGGPDWVEKDRWTIEATVSGDGSAFTGTAQFVYLRDVGVRALRTTLEERFRLKLRKATEQRPMYAMTVAKDGLKITQTAPQRCYARPLNLNLGRGQASPPPPGYEGTKECGISVHGTMAGGNKAYEVTDANMHDFALFLSGTMDRYVLDQTGVEGRFSFSYMYGPDDTTPGDREADRDPGFDLINGVRVPAAPRPAPNGPSIFKALEALGLKLDKTTGSAEYLQIESVQRPRPDSPEPGGGR